MPIQQNRVKWIALGRKLNLTPQEQQSPATEREIPIEESPFCVKMPDGATSLGVPIDTTLAISFIRNLWIRLDTLRWHFLKDNSRFFDSIRNLDVSLNENKISEKELKDVQHLINVADQLLQTFVAVTFDKSILLKMLSQPECEGIRFYACEIEGSSALKPIFSLVLVGVNKHGTDLHFEYEPDLHTRTEVPIVKNYSMTGEYGKALPQPGEGNKGNYEKELQPYVLYKYASIPDTGNPDE